MRKKIPEKDIMIYLIIEGIRNPKPMSGALIETLNNYLKKKWKRIKEHTNNNLGKTIKG